MSQMRIAFEASRSPAAQDAQARLRDRYGHVSPEDANLIVALGGDGFMLHCLHQHMDRGLPIYGMNRGSVGFLMNAYDEEGLQERLKAAREAVVHPLHMRAHLGNGETFEALPSTRWR